MLILLGIQRENLLMTNHTNYHLSKFQFNQPVGFNIFPIVYDQYRKKKPGWLYWYAKHVQNEEKNVSPINHLREVLHK